MLIPILSIGCLKAVYFNIKMSEPTNTIKTSYPNGKVVQRFTTIPYHGGSVAIQNDFTFDNALIIDLSEANVSYHTSQWKLHFMGSDLNNDTIHVDGDANVSTLFSVPPWYKFGDTLTITFNNFLKDISGMEYNLQPVYLVLERTKRAK